MKHEQLNYFDALRFLAKKYNIEIQERELTDKEKQKKSDRESMLIVNSWAQQYFTTQLYEHVEGKPSDYATLPNVDSAKTPSANSNSDTVSTNGMPCIKRQQKRI